MVAYRRQVNVKFSAPLRDNASEGPPPGPSLCSRSAFLRFDRQVEACVQVPHACPDRTLPLATSCCPSATEAHITTAVANRYGTARVADRCVAHLVGHCRLHRLLLHICRSCNGAPPFTVPGMRYSHRYRAVRRSPSPRGGWKGAAVAVSLLSCR